MPGRPPGRRPPGGPVPTTSLFAFATDFHDEGVEVALDRIQHRAGAGGVALAAVYHHGRDIFPHNPRRKVRFLDGGAAFFRPDPARYPGLRPHQGALADEWDALAVLREATAARGMELHAWTVFAHNTRLATEHPEAAVHNVYGDPQLTYLCPANPDVVAYSRALAGDIARYGCDTLVAESLHHHPLEHGFHHERYLIEIGPIDRFLLGLCFCDHCLAAGRRHGVDVESLRGAVRDRLDRLFASASAFDGREATRAQLGALWDGELDHYLEARNTAVVEAAAAVADELSTTSTGFAFMDQAGALKGYADGRPTGGPATEASWQLGVDPARLAPVCGEFQFLAYARDPERVRADAVAYRETLGPACGLRMALRPIPPDCTDADNLGAKFTVAREQGVGRADLYHYGFARLEALAVVKEALRSGRRGGAT